MVDLELLGLDATGQYVTLVDDDGRRYRLPIDDQLRAAVRRDRQRSTTVAAGHEKNLRPRDIQSLLRAGFEALDISETYGVDPERVLPFESPILAERSFIAQKAQDQVVSHEEGAPTLGELVINRLAARGVDLSTLKWDANRRDNKPWKVVVTFVAGDRERAASWQVDLRAKTISALDDEARWLSETDVSGSGRGRRRGHLTDIFGEPTQQSSHRTGPPPFDGQRHDAQSAPSSDSGAALAEDGATQSLAGGSPAGSHPEEADPVDEEIAADTSTTDPTESLLASLAAHRGTRSDLQDSLDFDALFGSSDVDADAGPPGSHPEPSEVAEPNEAQVFSLDERRAAQRGADPAGGKRRAERKAGPDEHREAADVDDLPPAPTSDDLADRSAASASETDHTEAGQDKDKGSENPQRPAKSSKKASSKRTDRRSIPKWEDIVFGARREDQ